jgi:transposase
MASIVRNKVGKYTYLYESESYRDENGQPRTRKISIGKIDTRTGEPIYKPEYLERVRGTDKQPNMAFDKQYSENDIKNSTIRDFGAFYLLESIAAAIGLLDVLKTSLPSTWEKIITLAFYLVSTGEPAMYCEDWIQRSECIPCGSMSSQKISELFSAISNEERLTFYEKWGELRSELEYMALDITSISSYSEFIGDVEWGYNRDNEQLPQVNVCMLFGETSKLPIFQTTYSGSLTDVTTLKTTLQLASGLKLNNLSIVMDKGFSRKDNIDTMLNDDEGIRFLIALPKTLNFVKEQIQSENQSIDTLDNTIVIGDDIIRGVVHKRPWNDEHDVYAHAFFNAEHAFLERNRLFGNIAKLIEEAHKNPKNPKFTTYFEKYLVIRKNKNKPSGYSVKVKPNAVEKDLQTKGWMVLISNHVNSPTKAIEIYRSKDVVEKGFMKLKNCLDLGRLRVHSDHRMQSKLFVGFIALIIMAHIHKVMSDNDMYERASLKKMIKTMERLRVQYINGHRILFPLTAEHKAIFKAFNIHHPM